MKKLKTRIAMLFLALGGITISGCAVMPSEAEEPDLAPLEDRDQDRLVDKIFETKYLKTNIDVNVAYQGEDMEIPDNYHVFGDATLDIEDLNKVAADVSLTLDMNDTPEGDLPKINFDFTYFENVAYLEINNRAVKLATDDFSELLDLVLGSGSDSDESTDPKEKTNITTSGIKDIVANIANMTVTNEGDHYKYVSKTTGDQPDLVITSDFEYNITSLAIAGIKYNDFTITVDIQIEVLSSLTNPITCPESAGHPYINLNTYFGTLRELRTILDDERFGMKYQLALTHYEPDTPNTKVYLGDTTGHLDMDLANSVVDLSATLNVSDIVTDDHKAYTTGYHGQYLDESIYIDYFLSNDRHVKLAYSNQGLSDMWELLGDNDVWGGTNIFDLIFGASDKEYPIIDILTDATYRNITKYGSINLDDNYIEVDVDNYLLGGKGHGSLKINLKEDGSIKNVTITSLDINSYIVDGILSFEDYQAITPVTKDDYHILDGLDDLIRDGSAYFQSNKYNVGLDLDIQDTDTGHHFTIDSGEAQVNIHQKSGLSANEKTGYDGYADITINDFDSHIHHLEINANPEGGETNVYAKYGYKASPSSEEVELKLKASRDTISSIFDQITGYEENPEGEGESEGSIDIMKTIAPYIAGATKDTLYRILKQGDYFAVLRDELINSISTTGDLYTIVLAKESFGFAEDITLAVQMDTSGETPKISYIHIETKYDKYCVNLTVTLKDNSAAIPTLEDKTGYIPLDSFTDILASQELHLDIPYIAVNKMVNSNPTPQEYVTVTDAQIDAELSDKLQETDDLWDRLYAKISGNVATSGGGSETTAFLLGYDEDNLSVKFGSDAKMSIPRSSVKDILDRAGNVMPKSEIIDGKQHTSTEEPVQEIVEEDGVNMFLEMMKILSEASYANYLNKIKSTTMANANEIVITIDNSMFRDEPEGTSYGTIKITFNSAGITGFALNDVRYGNYSISTTDTSTSTEYKVSINTERQRSKVDVTGYNEIYNIVDAVLNTATPKDIVLSGDIKLKAEASVIPAFTRDFSYGAFIHKENDAHDNESVYGYLRFDDVPFLFVGASESWGSYQISDNRDVFKNGDRQFEIFFSSTVKYDSNGQTIQDDNGNVTRDTIVGMRAIYYWSGNMKVKEKFVTSDDFMNDMTYYILNYGLGIKAKSSNLPDTSVYYGEDDLSTNANDFLNFHNYNIDNNYTPNLSTLLKSYSYSPTSTSTKYYTSSIYTAMTDETTNESWVVTIDGGNLINNSMIRDVELYTHTGVSGDTTYLNKAILTTKIVVAEVAVLGEVKLSAGLTVDYIPERTPDFIEDYEDILYVKQYIKSHPVGYRRYNDYNNAASLVA